MYSEDGVWKTLHVKWALELLSFLFDHYKDDRNIYGEIKNDFQKSLERIYTNFDEMTVLNVLNTIYNTIAVGKYVSIEVLNEKVKLPEFFTKYSKLGFYTLVKGVAFGS